MSLSPALPPGAQEGTAAPGPGADSSLNEPWWFGVLIPAPQLPVCTRGAVPAQKRAPNVGYAHLGNPFLAPGEQLSPPPTLLWDTDAVKHNPRWRREGDTRVPEDGVGVVCVCLSPRPAGFPSHLKLKPRRLWSWGGGSEELSLIESHASVTL